MRAFFNVIFFSCGLLKIDYCVIICEHNFLTFSASSREVRKLYLLWFKCFDSQQIKCSINPQASQKECVDHSEFINPSAPSALDCPSPPRPGNTTPCKLGKQLGACKPLLISQIMLSFQWGGYRYPGMNSTVNIQSDSLFGFPLQSK